MKAVFPTSMNGIELCRYRQNIVAIACLSVFMLLIALAGLGLPSCYLWRVPYAKWVIIGHLEVLLGALVLSLALGTYQCYIDLPARCIVVRRWRQASRVFPFTKVQGVEICQHVQRSARRVISTWHLAICLEGGRRINILEDCPEELVSRAAQELSAILEKSIMEARLQKGLQQPADYAQQPSLSSQLTPSYIERLRQEQATQPTRKKVKPDQSIQLCLRRKVPAHIAILAWVALGVLLSCIATLVCVPLSQYLQVSYMALVVWSILGVWLLYQLVVPLLWRVKIIVSPANLRLQSWLPCTDLQAPLTGIKLLALEETVFYPSCRRLAIGLPEGIYRLLLPAQRAAAVRRELLLSIYDHTRSSADI